MGPAFGRDNHAELENPAKLAAGPQRPLASLVAKTVKLAPASVVAGMLNRLQVEDPKTLFTVLKHLAKLTKKARIAVEFRRERPEQVPPDAGPLAPHASIADHIQDLFGQLPASEGPPELEPFEKVRNYVSTADVNEALTRTGNKATGLD